jgi:Tfp pilus assembly protein FimT
MTTPFPFVAGQVLTAAQLNDIQNLPISDKTASYTLLVGDVTKRTIMNSASATTITVDDAIFTVGDVIQVANKGAGTCTITAGAGVTINTSGSLALAQYGGGYLLALSASTFTFFNLGGGTSRNDKQKN